jgi:hypothetical protein
MELWLVRDGHDLTHTGASDEAMRPYSAAALLLYNAATINRKKNLSDLIARAEMKCGITAGAPWTPVSVEFQEALERLRVREVRTLQARAMAVVYEIKELRAQAEAVSGSTKGGRALMRRQCVRKMDLRVLLDNIDIWLCVGQDLTQQARAQLHVTADAAKLMLQSGEPPASWDLATAPGERHETYLQLHWGKLYHRVASDIARCEEELMNLTVEDGRLLLWVEVISSRVESARQLLPSVLDVSSLGLQASADAPCPYMQLGQMHARGELGVGAAVLLARWQRRLNNMMAALSDAVVGVSGSGAGGGGASDSGDDCVGGSAGGAMPAHAVAPLAPAHAVAPHIAHTHTAAAPSGVDDGRGGGGGDGRRGGGELP